jgi:hypothetical protein
MNKKWDWAVIELQYVQGDMSLRDLARENGISNHSSVMRHSKSGEWPRKREEYRETTVGRAVTVLAKRNGEALASEVEVRDNAVHAIDEMVTRLREDLTKTKKVMRDGVWVEEPLVVVRPNDVAMLIDRMQILFNKPSLITEERSVGALFSTDDPELLARLVDATAGVGLDGGATTSSPLPSAPGAGED